MTDLKKKTTKRGKTITKKSTNGTSRTGDFSSGEICDIIRACKDTNIAKLEVGSVHLSFFETIVDEDRHITAVSASVYDEPAIGRDAPVDVDKIGLTPDQDEQFEDVALEQMAFDDPVGYENVMIDKLVLDKTNGLD